MGFVSPMCVSTELNCRGGDSLRFKLKLFITIFFVVLDIGLNSSVEHDTIELYDTEQENMENVGDILALMLG